MSEPMTTAAPETVLGCDGLGGQFGLSDRRDCRGAVQPESRKCRDVRQHAVAASRLERADCQSSQGSCHAEMLGSPMERV